MIEICLFLAGIYYHKELNGGRLGIVYLGDLFGGVPFFFLFFQVKKGIILCDCSFSKHSKLNFGSCTFYKYQLVAKFIA